MKQIVVYMLLCEDGSFYTGWTTDLPRRTAAHMAGRGAKYTRSHKPVALAYAEAAAGRGEALRREAEIKSLTHTQKQALAGQYTPEALPVPRLPERENTDG